MIAYLNILHHMQRYGPIFCCRWCAGYCKWLPFCTMGDTVCIETKKYILQEMIYTFFIHCLLRRKGNGHDSFTESLMGGEAGILKLEI